MEWQPDEKTKEMMAQLVDAITKTVDDMIEDRVRPFRQEIEELKARIEALETPSS